MSDLITSGGDGRDRAAIVESGDELFDQLVDFITDNLAASSQRVYRHTYEQWRQFARRNQVDIFDLSLENVAACAESVLVRRYDHQGQIQIPPHCRQP